MSVELPKVKEDFASIVGSLVHHPWKMLQFILWLDLKLAEYKVYGSMMLDSNFSNIPKWLDFDGSCKSESVCPGRPVCQDPESNERIGDSSAATSSGSGLETDQSERISDISVSVIESEKSVSDVLPNAPSQSVLEADLSSRVSDRTPRLTRSETGLSKHVNDISQTMPSRLLPAIETDVSKLTTVLTISHAQNVPGVVPQSENSTVLSEFTSAIIPHFWIKIEPVESMNISQTQELPSDTSTNKCPDDSSGPSLSMSVDASCSVDKTFEMPPVCADIPDEVPTQMLPVCADIPDEGPPQMSPMCTDIPDEVPPQMPPVCADIPDEIPPQMPPVFADILDEGPAQISPMCTDIPVAVEAQMSPKCTDIPDEVQAQMSPVCTDIPDEVQAQMSPVSPDIPNEVQAQMSPVSPDIPDEVQTQMPPVSRDILHSSEDSCDVPRQTWCLEPVPPKTCETSGRQKINSTLKRVRLARPCPFCHKFQASLRRHIKTSHKNEEDVKDALKLSGNAQDNAFAQMRKRGIYQKNMSLLKCDKPLIRERRLHGTIPNGKINSGLKMCGTCKAFIAAQYFFKHKNHCGTNIEKKTDVPVNVFGNICNEKTENADFQNMLTVGQLCIGDEFIKTIGRSLLRKKSTKPGNKMAARNSTMIDMRLLASLCLAFKDAARKDGKEVTSESLFDSIYFKYLEQAILQVSYSEGNSIKSSLKLMIGYLLKRCIREMKATYLGKGEEERSASIEQFETVLMRRWTSIFRVSEVLKKRRRGQLPMEVEVEPVDRQIQHSLQEKDASTSGDESQEMPPLCADIPDQDPPLIMHCEEICPDEPEEASCLKSALPVTNETSLDTDRQIMDYNIIISAVKTNRKVRRPCPFCNKFQASLRRHIKNLHKDEVDVKDALKLSGNAQDLAFAQMRKQGIYQKNMSLLKCDKPLIRERRFAKFTDGQESKRLIMCGTCKAFIAAQCFSKHKNHCGTNIEKKTDVPVNVFGNMIIEKTENADFQHMLTKLTTDAVGQLCFGDEFIKTVGLSLWQKNNRNPDKTLTEMRRLASLFLAFKDAARIDEEVSSESMFDEVYFNYLEEAIQQVSYSEDNCVKSDQKQTIGRLLKKCITVMKATYLLRDEEERADSIDKFEAVLVRRWTSVFEDAEYLLLRERRNSMRRRGQQPKEVEAEAVDSSIEQLFQEEAQCPVDKSVVMSPESSCMDAPDGGSLEMPDLFTYMDVGGSLEMPPGPTCMDVGGSLVMPPGPTYMDAPDGGSLEMPLVSSCADSPGGGSLEMPTGPTCMDVHNEGPANTPHSAGTSRDAPEEAGCLEAVSPVTLAGRRYVHWSNTETTLLRNHFHDIIEDCSKTGLKGSLPGFREIQLFVNKHPTVLEQLEDKEKLKCIKAKLFNERSKRRRIFAEKLKTLR